MRSSSDLVLATLVAKKKPELVMRLGAGDLGGEKHALDIRLSAATLVSKSMRSAGDPGGEHKQLDAYNAHVL
jgi:hypothetical protein